ncbi:cupin domain-containing protein [Cyanobacterium aponinum AL20118]|nr:cupin domain-containing protein [Cyanobacterium aponinum]WPF88664.1 cupin domain-containing protein [Cyanobacterium aponinum AL20115]
MEGKKTFILRAAEIADSIQTFSHPWNSKSEISGVYLGRTVGLKRTGVNFARIAPGKESFVYHSHYREEEWIYILSGRGIAEIDG